MCRKSLNYAPYLPSHLDFQIPHGIHLEGKDAHSWPSTHSNAEDEGWNSSKELTANPVSCQNKDKETKVQRDWVACQDGV